MKFQISRYSDERTVLLGCGGDMELECCFEKDYKWFRYRAAAIIIENGCVLLAGNEAENYLYSVGGGVHHGETAEDAVKREVFEETGIHYEIDRLAVIHENFFDTSEGRLAGRCCHELSMYFLMKPRGIQEVNRTYSRTSFGDRETVHWIPIGNLNAHKHFPTFLTTYLEGAHDGVLHIVSDERQMEGR